MNDRPVKIFVEGEADKKFISDYLIFLNINFEENSIIICKGWNGIKEDYIKKQFERNTDDNGINLVIFDADDDFNGRINELNEIKNDFNIDFDLFLFPNNCLNGCLENLLLEIINPNNKPIIECWDNYENSLRNLGNINNGKPLTLPAIKTKIYAYLEALLENTRKGKEAIKENKRNYLNANHWCLNNPFLDSLKEFLKRYF